MRPAGTARDGVIDREARVFFTAILAAITVAAEDFTLAQPDAQARTADQVRQANDAGTRISGTGGANMAAAVLHQLGFADHQQANGAARIAHVERLEVAIE